MSDFGAVRLATISDQDLDPVAVEKAVDGPEFGAVVVFTGKVRNHDGGQAVTSLEYSAHPQAERCDAHGRERPRLDERASRMKEVVGGGEHERWILTRAERRVHRRWPVEIDPLDVGPLDVLGALAREPPVDRGLVA